MHDQVSTDATAGFSSMSAGVRFMLDSAKNKRPDFVKLEKRSVAPEASPDETSLSVFLAKIYQRKAMIVRWMLVGAIVGGLLGLAYVLVRTPAFTASSELLISNTTLQLSGPEAVVTQILVDNSLIQSAIEMLKSSTVLKRVIDRLGLEHIELILPKSRNIFKLGLDLSKTSRRQAALAVLRSNITVNRVGASQVISVLGRALTAEDAARLTNEIAASFVQEESEINAVITTSAALRERIKVIGPTVRIISEAAPPNAKDGLAVGVALALAGMVGGLLGLGVGLAITFFDRRVRCAAQLAAVMSGECFGYLPRMAVQHGLRSRRGRALGAGMRRNLSLSPPALHDPQAEFVPVLRRVRSAVLERCGSAPHFIGVTSCRRGEGKTTFAASWAGLIAADGSRVLLVDAARNDHALSNILTPGDSQGLHELLRGEAVAEDVIRTEMCPNLDFVPAGRAVGNLDMQWFNLVQAVGAIGDRSYEWVILDLPELAPVADVRSAGQVVDELLIVVEWGCTSEAQLEHALQSLGPVRDKLLGALISKTPWNSLGWQSRAERRGTHSSSVTTDIRTPKGEDRQ
jgi:Mrp family chromosome partitioning ATPase/capsular polysaccharide biosynthesis protein